MWLLAPPSLFCELWKSRILGPPGHFISLPGRGSGQLNETQGPDLASNVIEGLGAEGQGGPIGVDVDQQLKKLIKELGDAISESLTESEQIADVISRIKAGGYDIFLVLEATIGFNRQDEKPSRRRPTITARTRVPEFKLNSQDMKLLKSLKISAEDAA